MPIFQKLGIKPSEQKQVLLFFLHNFFIGIGSILIYTSANVILLENHPEFSLPIAYIASAFLMMIVGKIYEHYEHHLQLKSLSANVLIVVCSLSVLIVMATFFSHSMLMAIIIMVAYRVIYLLVNLEFWGLSALLFDVRQSKRLFSIIGAGDMPAKLLGAILAALIHAPSAVPLLISIATIMFMLALFTQKRSFDEAHIIKENHIHHAESGFDLTKLFGRNQLIFRVSLGYALIVTIAIFIEFSFFLNVKHKFHSQHDTTIFIGKILAITYLVGMVFKLMISQRFLERLGVRIALFILPALAFLLSTILVFLLRNETDEQLLIFYFCAYYLSFEVIRRTVFDPVFLIIFQPLSSHQRLKGHTLAKGFYEPLGIGITGFALLFIYYFPQFDGWFDFIFVAIIAFCAIVVFNATYRSYVFTLQSAIRKRFIGTEEFGVREEAIKIYRKLLESQQVNEVLTAFEWLRHNQSGALLTKSEWLLKHDSPKVRMAIFNFLDEIGQHHEKEFYTKLLRTEDDPSLKFWFAKHIADTQMMSSTDRSIMKGAIVGGLEQNNPSAQRALQSLLNTNYENSNLLGLEILGEASIQNTDYLAVINDFLKSKNSKIREKAIELAKAEEVIDLIDSHEWKSVVKNLVSSGEDSIALIDKKIANANGKILSRLLRATEQLPKSKTANILYKFALDFRTREKALKALGSLRNKLDKADFEAIFYSELALAQKIFEGLGNSKYGFLKKELEHEIDKIIRRLFDLLMLNYDKATLTNALVGVQHFHKEKRANSYEMLENTLPKSIYQCLQAILDDSEFESKIRVIEKFSSKKTDNQPLIEFIIDKKDTVFGDWTVSKALLNYTGDNEEILSEFLTHPNKLLKESAWKLVKEGDFSNELKKTFTMNHIEEENQISEIERVIILKNTPLFQNIPENVLSAVAPIMYEVNANEGEIIFRKGDWGDSMYVVYEGEVAVVDGNTEFARFRKYDFFGELALLDSESRSASALVKADSILFKINQEDFYELLEERPELMRNIIKALSHRIRVQNAKMVSK